MNNAEDNQNIHKKEVAEERSLSNDVIETTLRRLGDYMDIELPVEHMKEALALAFRKYRQRSSNSLEESYAFLTLKRGVTEYVVDKNIIDIKIIYRGGVSRSFGTNTTTVDPFNINFFNTYLLNPMTSGSLLTYELYGQKMELMKRMFKGHLNYVWHEHSRTVSVVESPRVDGEVVILHTYNYKPDETLLSETRIRPWIEDWCLMECKKMLGLGRGKFQSLGGPSGGTSLNASDLLQQAQQEEEKLIQEIKDFVDGSEGWGFIIG